MQGSIVNIKADAIVHPTNNSFYMGGDVGEYSLIKFNTRWFRESSQEKPSPKPVDKSCEILSHKLQRMAAWSMLAMVSLRFFSDDRTGR